MKLCGHGEDIGATYLMQSSNGDDTSTHHFLVSGYLRERSWFLTEDSEKEISLLVRFKSAWNDKVTAWRKLVAIHHLPGIGKREAGFHGFRKSQVQVLRSHESIRNLRKDKYIDLFSFILIESCTRDSFPFILIEFFTRGKFLHGVNPLWLFKS